MAAGAARAGSVSPSAQPPTLAGWVSALEGGDFAAMGSVATPAQPVRPMGRRKSQAGATALAAALRVVGPALTWTTRCGLEAPTHWLVEGEVRQGERAASVLLFSVLAADQPGSTFVYAGPFEQAARRPSSWLAKGAQAQRLPRRRRHLTPQPLLPEGLVITHKKVAYSLLLRTVGERLRKLPDDPEHLGAESGVVAILDIWTQSPMQHPTPTSTAWCPAAASRSTQSGGRRVPPNQHCVRRHAARAARLAGGGERRGSLRTRRHGPRDRALSTYLAPRVTRSRQPRRASALCWFMPVTPCLHTAASVAAILTPPASRWAITVARVVASL